ncbi:hypothetical protein MBOT_05090 [Mycobacterium botniense]|uniref:DUF3060 domain-containing protein n=2 Tax=Mycobacterium botniense TaxID=84962 RepID=A0A7I9XT56_9MYCO|nr:hypothetical protein MBOT_05090 [Mycobacterium botniense]
MRAISTDFTRPAAGALAVTLAALLAAFAPAGCAPKNKGAAPSTTSTASAGAQFEVGNTLNYASFGTTAELDCGNGKSLDVGGSNNTLTVKGTCASVNIGGADNKVTLDKIDQHLSVVGLNNTVIYKSGDPKVDNLGSGNTITKK